jgi:hypothetical protein
VAAVAVATEPVLLLEAVVVADQEAAQVFVPALVAVLVTHQAFSHRRVTMVPELVRLLIMVVGVAVLVEQPL